MSRDREQWRRKTIECSSAVANRHRRWSTSEWVSDHKHTYIQHTSCYVISAKKKSDKTHNWPLSRFRSVKSTRETNAVLSRWPLQPDVNLCRLTQGKLQDFTRHRGHRYLNTATSHTSQRLHKQTFICYLQSLFTLELVLYKTLYFLYIFQKSTTDDHAGLETWPIRQDLKHLSTEQ